MARRNLEGNKFVGLSVVPPPPPPMLRVFILFLFFPVVNVISSAERAGPALIRQPVNGSK